MSATDNASEASRPEGEPKSVAPSSERQKTTFQWISLILAITSLLFGGGLITSWMKGNAARAELVRQQEIAAISDTLNTLLEPLSFMLQQNRQIHGELTKELNLRELEYAPDYIQNRVRSLPEEHPMRRLWLARIRTLIENNQWSIELIRVNSVKISDPDLKRALADFVAHAQAFNDIWRAIQAEEQIRSGVNRTVDLYSERYPAVLDALIEKEKDRLRSRLTALRS